MMPFMKAWFLASCRFCDKIAVFDRGQIVQTDGHEELLSAEGGKYASLDGDGQAEARLAGKIRVTVGAFRSFSSGTGNII